MSDKPQETIKYHKITETWGTAKECREWSIKIDNWLNQFDDNTKPIMLQLLKHFHFYSEYQVGKKVVELHNLFKHKYPIESAKAIYYGIEKDYQVGYSDLIISSYWYKNVLYDVAGKNLKDVIRNGQIPEIIAIIDDYSGTGNSFTSYLSTLEIENPNIKKSQIFFLTLESSKTALKRINEFSAKQGYNITFLTLIEHEEAFNPDYIFKLEKIPEYKQNYHKSCTNLKIKPNYIWGYENISALVSFYYNTPNNTLGAFWCNVNDFIALFVRHKKRKTTLSDIQEKVNQNKSLNGTKTFIQNVDETKLNIFIVYCIAWGKQLSIEKAKKDFGLTDNQFNDIMQTLCAKGYLDFSTGKVSPSKSMRQYVFSSRIKDFKKIYYSSKEDYKIPVLLEFEDTYIPSNFTEKFNGYK